MLGARIERDQPLDPRRRMSSGQGRSPLGQTRCGIGPPSPVRTENLGDNVPNTRGGFTSGAQGQPAFQLLKDDTRYTPSLPGDAPAATFVGSNTCAGCHRTQTQLWRGSQHKQAMDHATEKAVLGDFSDVTFNYYGVQSRFFRRDGKFLVETDGPDGKLATFEVKYTFGVDPLQQYLIEFPDGRLQALSLAWDSRPKEKGGQRWFHLYPNEEIRHDDVLHWTKLNQNWNFMCAECHSTGVRKNYDATGDRFATTFAEISVGCEACHGQGSRHVGWAHEQGSLVAVRQN